MTESLRIGVDAGGTGTRAIVLRGDDVVERLTDGPLNVLLHADALDRLARLIISAGATEAGLGLAGVRSPVDAARIAGVLKARTGARRGGGRRRRECVARCLRRCPRHRGDRRHRLRGLWAVGRRRSVPGRRSRLSARRRGRRLLDRQRGDSPCVAIERRHRPACCPSWKPWCASIFLLARCREIEAPVYAAPTDRSLLAALVPTLAASDSAAVAAIFDEAAVSLAALVTAVRHRLGPLPVAMTGGVWNVAAVRSRFVELTGAVDPLHPPEWGALLLLEPSMPKEIA